jgi:SSS family solute:Na+ symporter
LIYIFLAILTLYFVGGTLIALLSRKFVKGGFEDFVVGGYRVGGFLSAMTYAATTYSAFMMVGLVGLTYATGVAALGFELVYLASTIGILTTIGPTIWVRAREKRWVTPSQMIGELYSSKTLASSIAILYLVALTPYLAAQLKGIGEIFTAIGLSYEVGVVVAIIATFIWIAIAGLWSVATTDAFQGLWMISASVGVTIWALAYLLPSAGIDLEKTLNILVNARTLDNRVVNLMGFAWSISMFIGMSLPWIFFALTNPQVVQRIYIPKDAKAYKRMVTYFAIYGFVYTLICVILGLASRAYIAVAYPEIELNLIKARDSVSPTILCKAHPILSSIAFVSILAAAVSTANSIALSAASAVTRDLYISYSRNVDEKKAATVTVLATLFMLLVALAIALGRVTYVVELAVTSSAILIPLAPITVAGIVLEPRRRGLPYAVTSLTLGLAVAVLAIAMFGPAKALTQPLVLELPAPLWSLLASAIPILAMVYMVRKVR